MKKSILLPVLSLLIFTCLSSCSTSTENSTVETEAETEVLDKVVEVVELEEESSLGNYSGLVGSWTIDAETAGVQLDITFGEDGSFSHVMGTVVGEGTWEIIDEEHIQIITQNTTGQTWKVTDLMDETVNICWNPDNPTPKILPMQRVQ